MTGAQIGPQAKVGKEAVIGPLALLKRGCTIGEGAIIATRTQVRDACHVGENVEIERGCLITNEAKLQDCPSSPEAATRPTRIGAETMISGTEIQPGVRVGPGAQTDGRGTIHQGAQIGAHSLVQGTVGRDAKIGTDVILMPGTEVGEGATVGDKAVVWRHSEVEKNAVVAPGRTVPPSEFGDDEHKVRIKAPTQAGGREETPVRGKGRPVGGTPAPKSRQSRDRTR